MRRSSLIIFVLVILMLGSCQKQVTVEASSTSPTRDIVFSTDAGVAEMMTGIYGQMAMYGGIAQGLYGVSLVAGLAADELMAYPESGFVYMDFYTNSKRVDYSLVWRDTYKYIYRTNDILEGIGSSISISDSARRQFTGEAKFMRAFLHFYLVNLFGDIPLVLSTDYEQNRGLSRAPKEVVYNQIIADLKDAVLLLKDYYVTPDGTPTDERVRPTKMAAAAMLARVYLYKGEWAEAEKFASLVINHSKLSLSKIDQVFVKNNSEAIWQLQPVTMLENSMDALHFIRTIPPGSSEPVDLRPALLSKFEPGDLRRNKWIDSITLFGTKHYYPSKYRVKFSLNGAPPKEYPMMLRLSEMYLVRAEALAMQAKLVEAVTSLKEIRKRAGLSTDASEFNTQEKAMTLIMHERQVELFTEWGHRWFDLNRTNTIDKVMQEVAPLKGGVWQSFARLFPIPPSEIAKAPNLVQNPGY